MQLTIRPTCTRKIRPLDWGQLSYVYGQGKRVEESITFSSASSEVRCREYGSRYGSDKSQRTSPAAHLASSSLSFVHMTCGVMEACSQYEFLEQNLTC
jgi:hypothetical protein